MVDKIVGMLKTHLDEKEALLLHTSRIPANSGHSLHKGTPRESFIKTFLSEHLSERVAIGTGEIIDANSIPGQPRNQIDIVIYKRDYPKLDFGGGINAFLCESVVATIEVKSTLDKAEFEKATTSARNTKALTRHVTTAFAAGYHPPAILSYVVAYDGPASMRTVHGWLESISQATGIAYPALPRDAHQRYRTPSPSLDGVFVLGRGFMQFGNSPVSFLTQQTFDQHPELKWALCDTKAGSLLLFFMLLTTAVSGTSGSWLDAGPYLSDFHLENTMIGT